MVDSLRPGARVLDLGCGVGRLANHLAACGHEVVAVDSSAAMLAHLDKRVRAVHASIETLDLGERFDAVVLASNLVNIGDDAAREAFLAACARHLASDGSVFIEHYPPDWAATVDRHEAVISAVRISFAVQRREGNRFQARVDYFLGDEHWRQDFTGCVLTESEIEALLESRGLFQRRRLTPGWLEAGLR